MKQRQGDIKLQKGEIYMQHRLPRSINKSELKRDVAKWETKFKEQKKTLSQTLDDPKFIGAWDTSLLTTAEVALIHEHFVKSSNMSLLLIQLKG